MIFFLINIEDIKWFEVEYRNVINSKFRTLDVEYGIYFMSETGFLFFVFTNAKHEWKYQKIGLTREVNSIFNVKSSEFSVYYMFVQILDTACAMHDVTSQSLVIFTHCENYSFVKITACKVITVIQWIKPGNIVKDCHFKGFSFFLQSAVFWFVVSCTFLFFSFFFLYLFHFYQICWCQQNIRTRYASFLYQ